MLLARALASIALLPGTAIVIVPGLLLWAGVGSGWTAEPGQTSPLGLVFGVLCAAAGLVLAGWTIVDFTRRGRGTLAPWDPPKNFLVTGPYRHVRNPMITGVALILVAEALLLHAVLVAAWAVVFFLINAAYIPKKEEPGPEKRLGAAYGHYRENVPRWMPRFTPWEPPPDRSSS
tara:strand:- start:374 stop:898 length:525 start_codon:yes stop_codon:yes gene_type:complete